MSRVAFISDLDTPLGEYLVRLYVENGNRVFTTIDSVSGQTAREEFSGLADSAGEQLLIEQWHRHSPISAKNMYLRALTHFGRLDEVLLIGNPSIPPVELHAIPFETLDRTVDSWIKGSLFFLKAVLDRFVEEEGGVVALISVDFNHPDSPLEEAVRHAFQGLAHSLLKTYASRGININAFESSVSRSRQFAGFIYRSLTERGRKDSGRWLRYRTGILPNLGI